LPELAGRAAIPIVNKSNFENFQIAVPSVEEQRSIAAALGAIDNKIEFEQRRRSALESVFGALLNILMTGELRLPKFVPAEPAEVA
jgi:type I restriction enzyme S subunit